MRRPHIISSWLINRVIAIVSTVFYVRTRIILDQRDPCHTGEWVSSSPLSVSTLIVPCIGWVLPGLCRKERFRVPSHPFIETFYCQLRLCSSLTIKGILLAALVFLWSSWQHFHSLVVVRSFKIIAPWIPISIENSFLCIFYRIREFFE